MLAFDMIVLFFAVPSSMWIMKTYKEDKITLLWIIPWTLLLFYDNTAFDVLLFILGLILGIITDLAGVMADKWWYPHYNNRTYSMSAFWGWGIITLIIFRWYNIIIENLLAYGWVILASFAILWLIVEIKKGKTSVSNQWVVLRGVLTIIFLFISEDILFLFVASIGAIYIEILGTELKIWVYNDISPSYLFLGVGYAQLSYLCLLITSFILYNLVPSFLQILLIVILVLLYLIDYYLDLRKKS